MAEDARMQETRMNDEARRWAETQRAELAKSAWVFVERNDITPALAQLDPTALRTMLSAASDASCLQEIKILFRYQSGRDRLKWSPHFVTAIEAEMQKVIDQAKKSAGSMAQPVLDIGEALIAASWLGFVVRLHRFHYETAREAARGDRGARR